LWLQADSWAHSARATISLRHVMAKSISLAKQLTVQGSPATPATIPRVCALSAQQSANPRHVTQTRCQPAAHRQGMTTIDSFSPLASAMADSQTAETATRCSASEASQDRMARRLLLLHARAADRTQHDAGIPAVLRLRTRTCLPRPQLRQFSRWPVGGAQAGGGDIARPCRRARELCRCLSQVPPTPGRARLRRPPSPLIGVAASSALRKMVALAT
jgi:hypothetical protein